ncbi:MAG: serine/threonine-protein kinase, partial [Pseudomonadota bacterium]
MSTPSRSASSPSTSRAPFLLPPDSMVDHFRVVRLVGRGGMGEVYLARDTLLNRKVALKVVHPRYLDSVEAVTRFMHEAQLTASLSHPHIVTVYAVGKHDGRPYLALEYLEGQNLRQRLDEERPGVRESLRIVLAIAQALAEAHRHQVLHRDLKPENVILAKDGRLRLVDLGLANKVTAAVTQPATNGETGEADEARTGVLAVDATTALRMGSERRSVTVGRSHEGVEGRVEAGDGKGNGKGGGEGESVGEDGHDCPTAAGILQGTPAYMAPE